MTSLGSSDADNTARGLVPGERVFGRFRLKRFLGLGGMGCVWLATDERLGCEVALKFLADRYRWDEVALLSLREETRRARTLTHPGIVRIHDLHEEEGQTALAMEFVPGGSLQALRVARTPPVLGWDEIARWLPALCEAIDHAHSCQIVHRDLKPSNLLVAADGALKIADFGIAQPLAETALRISQWVPSGTLAYMSPQQHFGDPPARTDDIYALGATLYELLTGKPPFHSGNLALQIERRNPDPINERRARLGAAVGEPIPPAWEKVISACLAKSPESRPQNARTVAEALRAPKVGTRSSYPLREGATVRWWVAGVLGVLILGGVAWLGSSREAGRSDGGAPAAVTVHPSDATRAWGAWRFDGNGLDASGGGRTLRFNRVVPTKHRFGRVDGAVFLNGSSTVERWQVMPDEWGPTVPFSVALWLKPEGMQHDGVVAVALRSEKMGEAQWSLAIESDTLHFSLGRLQVVTNDVVRADHQLVPGRWVHVAVVSDGESLKLFIDGALRAEKRVEFNQELSFSGPATLFVGSGEKTDLVRFAGAIDDLRIWRRVVSREEIEQLATEGAAPRFIQSVGAYSAAEDLPAAVVREFGPEAKLADWEEIRRWHWDDVEGWCDDLALSPNVAGPLLQRAGSREAQPGRQYFLTRFAGVKPEYYLAHDELGGMRLALGSWGGVTQRLLVLLPSKPPRVESVAAKDELGGVVAKLGRGGRRPVRAVEVEWMSALGLQPSLTDGALVSMAGGKDIEAICRVGDAGRLAVALGFVNAPAVSRQTAAFTGLVRFTIVVKDGSVSFRAVSVQGGAVLFQEVVEMEISASAVLQVRVPGVDMVKLTQEE